MARDSGGTYSLPAGNPVVSGAAIDSSDHNDTMNDFATEITDSLSRAGKGGMSGMLELANGSVSTPGLSFVSDTNTGLYRVTANDLGLSAGGAIRAGVDVDGLYAYKGTVGEPGLSFYEDRDLGFYRVGANVMGVSLGGTLYTRFNASGIQTDVGAGLEQVSTQSVAVKTATETVNNSSTLQDDDHLIDINLAAAMYYEVDLYLIVDGMDTAGLKINFALTQTPVVAFFQGMQSQAASTTTQAATSSSLADVSLAFTGVSGKQAIHVKGVIKSHASLTSVLKLQWAQNSAISQDTIMWTGSYLKVSKIA